MAIKQPTTKQVVAPLVDPATPMWKYAEKYAHWGPDRLDEAFEEAVRAPYSNTMRRRAAGAELSIHDIVRDIVEVLERV